MPSRTPYYLVGLMIACSIHPAAASPSDPTPGSKSVVGELALPEAAPPARVGQIFIVGSRRTSQKVISDQLGFYPGQVLTPADLARAERNLARLGIFQNNQTTRPSVRVIP